MLWQPWPEGVQGDHPTALRPVLQGSWWERFDESPRDVAAWINFVVASGVTQVVLIGHSFGALKAVYSLAERPDPRVSGLVIASPPVTRLRAIEPQVLAVAEKMSAEGRAHELLPWGSHVSILGALAVSAQTYLSWAGGKRDVFGVDSSDPPIAHITCPVLAFYSTSNDIGGADDLDADSDAIRPAVPIQSGHLFR
jgi:pimeloyl-ACP methyl ester carboxylesterase